MIRSSVTILFLCVAITRVWTSSWPNDVFPTRTECADAIGQPLIDPIVMLSNITLSSLQKNSGCYPQKIEFLPSYLRLIDEWDAALNSSGDVIKYGNSTYRHFSFQYPDESEFFSSSTVIHNTDYPFNSVSMFSPVPQLFLCSENISDDSKARTKVIVINGEIAVIYKYPYVLCGCNKKDDGTFQIKCIGVGPSLYCLSGAARNSLCSG